MWSIRGKLLCNAVHKFPCILFAVTIETNRLPKTKSCSNMLTNLFGVLNNNSKTVEKQIAVL